MNSSSTSSGGMERRVPSPAGLPVLKLAMVGTVHVLGSAAAFFKESMRRDAMTGTKIGCNLWETS